MSFSLACLFCMNESLFACLTLFVNSQLKTDRVSYFHQTKLIEKNAIVFIFSVGESCHNFACNQLVGVSSL